MDRGLFEAATRLPYTSCRALEANFAMNGGDWLDVLLFLVLR